MTKNIRFRWTVFTAAVCLAMSGCGDSGGKITLEQALGQQAQKAQEMPAYRDGQAAADVGDAANVRAGQDGQNVREETVQAARPDTVWVHICGEVETPGVYELAAGSRICDALLAAGGFTAGADTEFLNLAEPVSDGMQIVVFSVEETQKLRQEKSREQEEGQAADGRVNINTATAEQLCTLPGIGESRARDIIAYREKHGGFAKPEQIMEVSGIKQAVYEKIKELITV